MPSTLPIQQLHHVSHVTWKLDQSKAFYRDVLGFRELERPNFSFRGAWLEGYGMQIHLIENQELDPSPRQDIQTRAEHVAFGVSDLGPVRKALAEHGIPFRETVNAARIRQIFFQDPDGHNVEIAVFSEREPVE